MILYHIFHRFATQKDCKSQQKPLIKTTYQKTDDKTKRGLSPPYFALRKSVVALLILLILRILLILILALVLPVLILTLLILLVLLVLLVLIIVLHICFLYLLNKEYAIIMS